MDEDRHIRCIESPTLYAGVCARRQTQMNRLSYKGVVGDDYVGFEAKKRTLQQTQGGCEPTPSGRDAMSG